MKKLSFFLALVLPLFAFAAERSAADAAALAAEFMNQQVNAPARKASVGSSAMQLSHTRQKLNSAEPAFYVFNATSNGFVVVSADDRTEDVLMYSEEGTLDVENANPNLKFWLGRLQRQISAANDENTYTAVEKKSRKATTVTAISPLLVNDKGKDITWNQGAPYWNQCPMDGSSRSYTGCVATAAAQIMYKWRYPAKGTGSHSYTTDTKKISVSQDFSQVTFDWTNMLPAYGSVSYTTAQANAVAWLMRCCGVACDMDYTNNGSGARTDVMGKGMINYFGYKAQKHIMMGYYSSEFTDVARNLSVAQFTTYFNTDLEAGRPILLGGVDNEGGHEFVCDGRDANGKFHINWGWEGEGNCYCTLSALAPTGSSSGTYDDLDAIFGLEPATTETIAVTGVTMAPTTLTLKQKAKATLTATVAPSNATDKSVTWSSSNNAVATVSDAGLVTGVSKGSATITVTTTDGNKKATCAVTVTEEVIEVEDCDKYSYTFTSKCTTGENTLGDYTWNIALQAGAIQNIDSEKGQQLGSRNTPCLQATFTSSDPAECLINNVLVAASIASSGDGKLAVYIGGTQIGSTQTLTTTNTEYTFSNTAGLQGNLEIRMTNSARAMYIRKIEVNPVVEQPDTTSIDLTNKMVRLVDAIATNGLYQFHGNSDDNQYLCYVAMQNVSSIVGKVTASNLYANYTALYQINGTDTTQITYDAFLGGEVTLNNKTYLAKFNFQVGEKVYVLSFKYANPEFDPTRVDTISGIADLNFNYWSEFESYGYKLWITEAWGSNYIYQGFFLGDNTVVTDTTKLAGTYTQDNMYEQGIYDANTLDLAFEVYQSSITFKRNSDGTYTITGTLLCYGNQTIILNLTTPQIGPADTFTLTLKSNNPSVGYVIGGGSYEQGTEVPVAAVCTQSGYTFKNWSDGNTAAGRNVTVTKDITLTAYFDVFKADTVEVHDTAYVPVEIHDTTYIEVHDTAYIEIHDTTYIEVHDTTYISMLEVNALNPLMGEALVQILAVPNDGYEFTQWTDGDTSNPRTIELTDEPQSYTAEFAPTTPTSTRKVTGDDASDVSKILKDGKLYVLRDGKTYNAVGSEVK